MYSQTRSALNTQTDRQTDSRRGRTLALVVLSDRQTAQEGLADEPVDVGNDLGVELSTARHLVVGPLSGAKFPVVQ